MKVSLHEQIRSDFESQILTGKLSPGDRLPTEKDLMAQFDCSRMTVNKALSSLVAAGLIERKKKAGTFVTRPRVHSMILDIPDLPTELAERGQQHRYELVGSTLGKSGEMPGTEDWGGPSSDELLCLDGVHFADEKPFAFEHRLVCTASVPDIENIDFKTQSPGSWLLQNVPWTEAETRISACGLNPEYAQRLNVPSGTPCLNVERRTWRAKDAVTFVRQTFLSDFYELIARFGPEQSR